MSNREQVLAHSNAARNIPANNPDPTPLCSVVRCPLLNLQEDRILRPNFGPWEYRQKLDETLVKDAGWCELGIPKHKPTMDDKLDLRPSNPGEFVFPAQYRSPSPLPSLRILQAADPPPPTGIARFPRPTEWVLEENSQEFLRGGCYVRKRSPDDFSDLRESVLYIGKHPDLKPIYKRDPLFPDRQCLDLPDNLRGLLLTQVGIPYYQAHKDRVRDCTLIAITHTPESILEQYPNTIGSQGAAHMRTIQDLMFTLEPGEKEFWWKTTPWKDNDRSAGQGTGEGSFSLAGTIQKGEGKGVYVPATQNASPLVRKTLLKLLSTFGKLHRIMHLTSQRADHFMLAEAEQEINNSPRIGDGDGGGTSVQLNIHFSRRPFAETIGFEQAEPHTDEEDDPCHPTMTVHLTTTPYGSYRGHMWLGECGLVIPFVTPVQVSLFDATSIHTPQQPAFLKSSDNPPLTPEDVPLHLRAPGDAHSNGHIRLCFIIYNNRKALRRTAPMNFGHKITRGDMANSLGEHRKQFAKLSDPQRSIWSTPFAQWNHMVMEEAQGFHNFCVGFETSPPDPNFLLSNLRHPVTGESPILLPEDLNPVASLKTYQKYVGMILYQRKVHEALSLGVRHHELACSQASVKTFGLGTPENKPAIVLRYASVNKRVIGPAAAVESILGVRQHASSDQVLINVKLQGRESPKEFALGTWIRPYMKDFVKALQASQTFLEIIQPRTTKTRCKHHQDNEDLGARTQAMLLDVDFPERSNSSESDVVKDAADACGNGRTGYDPYTSSDDDQTQGSQDGDDDADYVPSSSAETSLVTRSTKGNPFQAILASNISPSFLDEVFNNDQLDADLVFLKKQLPHTTSFLRQGGSASLNHVLQNASRDRSVGTAVGLMGQLHLPTEQLTEKMGKALLSRSLLSMQNIQRRTKAQDYTLVVYRVLTREIAPLYISIWEWFVVHGSNLVTSLWHTHNQHGTNTLCTKFPGFSPLFLLLKEALEEWYQVSPHHSTRRQTQSGTAAQPCIVTHDHFKQLGVMLHQGSPQELSILHTDSATFPSPKSSASKFMKYHSDLFIEVLYRIFMHPYIEHIYKDTITNRSTKTSQNRRYVITPTVAYESFKDILLVRGGVLHLVLQGFQTEAVFALGRPIDDLIRTPRRLFKADISRNRHYAQLARVFMDLGQVDELVEMFRDTLEEYYIELEDFPQLICEIGQKLYHHTLQLERGKLLSNKEFLDGKSVVTLDDHQPVVRRALRAKRTALDQIVLKFSDLVVCDEGSSLSPLSLSFHPITIIIRAGLRHTRLKDARGTATSQADYKLHNMQMGRHIITASEVMHNDVDHMRCIREQAGYIVMIREYLPAALVRTPLGFVNHYIFFATGQSPQTREFYAIQPTFLTQPSDIPRKLNVAIHQHGMEWNQVENMCCWGTANPWISWRGSLPKGDPKRKQEDRPEKCFTPLFDPTLLSKISVFLLECEAAPPAWSFMHTWILENIRFKGVGGLTLLQLTNNLACLGICQKPTLDELGLWICHHYDLGAMAELQFLGFRLSVGQPRRTSTALKLLYDHLDINLTAEDKESLVFDTIFLEHLLCKVARWSRLYNKQKCDADLPFSDFTSSICKVAPKWDGATSLSKTSPDILPIPLALSNNLIGKTLQDVNANRAVL